MDVTGLARSLLEPIPANRLLGITVLRADAAGLAAVIAASEAADDFRGVIPLGP